MTKKAIIIDDEHLSRALIREYAEAFPELEIVAEAADGFEAMKCIRQYKPDLLFLDIQMPKINGFELLELLDEKPAVIFITAFDAYALQAFDANALDYILKPFDSERFNRAIHKFLAGHIPEISDEIISGNALRKGEFGRMVVKKSDRIIILPFAEICYVEAYDDYIKMHTASEVYVKKMTLSKVEEIDDAHTFIRVHRSYMVNSAYIGQIQAYEKESFRIILKDGRAVPLSKTGYQRLREQLRF